MLIAPVLYTYDAEQYKYTHIQAYVYEPDSLVPL